MKNQKYGFIDSDFSFYIEPENGINSSSDFIKELTLYADKSNAEISVVSESMEPVITFNGAQYLCKLGEPFAAAAANPIFKLFRLRGLNRPLGRFFGYKWIYAHKL